MTEYKKKLIEVALPLEAINRESARESFIYKGNPSSVHKWWAQRPLAACRAVLFASLVDDPSAHPDQFPDSQSAEAERERLFHIIEELVVWENSTNEAVLEAARAEILRSTNGNPPPVLDPFCGGGSIPLEAQRLGLKAYGSDLNPVAVLISKALIEIPPQFAGMPPVNPDAQARANLNTWRDAQGLAEDIRFFGRWMRDQAEDRIGELYPSIKLPAEHGGGQTTVIAWLWARTVVCPNPACGATMPLVRSFALSTKKSKRAWAQPIIDHAAKTVRFVVRGGDGVAPEGTVNRQGARCIVCGGSVPFEHIRAEARADRMGSQLMAEVADGPHSRVYITPDDAHMAIAASAVPAWTPDTDLPEKALSFRVQAYGMTKHRDLFTNRQLVALATFSDLVAEARELALRYAEAAIAIGAWGAASGRPDDRASRYADAVRTYLAFSLDKAAEYGCTLVPWYPKEDRPKGVFARQSIPMVWDFAEINPLGHIGGTPETSSRIVADAIADLSGKVPGVVRQLDATAASGATMPPLVSTDPPYYDNIGYADLSDFFYVWLRHSLRDTYPDLFSTLLTPKAAELIASPYRFEGDKQKARSFFERGLGDAFRRIRRQGNPDYPLTVYYAFKQTESGGDGSATQTASTGWETMLAGLLDSGFAITGTWPMRSERSVRSIAIGTNALASSVVLVCRPRRDDAPLASRREFLSALRSELPEALQHLQRGNIAPVDLAQASIGPGMAIFTRYSKVMESDGSAMSVRTALELINQALDEVMAEQEGEFDADTRWAISWFQEVGLETGEYGRAELLSTAKNTSVQGMVEAGIAESRAGKVRLLRRDELDEAWDPATDKRLTVWEMTQQIIRRLDGGEASAASLARRLGSNAEVARDLAYRLYLICERRRWAQEALAYNTLVVAWPEIQRLAATAPASAGPSQTSFEV